MPNASPSEKKLKDAGERSASHEVTIEIPFHDCDPLGIVWHGHYAKYFEIARCALLETIDYNYGQMYESGYAWPVIDMQVRYVQSAHFGDKIKVSAKITEWEYRLKIDYVITKVNTGERITKGYTTQVAVDVNSQEMCFGSPPILKQLLDKTSKDNAGNNTDDI